MRELRTYRAIATSLFLMALLSSWAQSPEPQHVTDYRWEEIVEDTDFTEVEEEKEEKEEKDLDVDLPDTSWWNSDSLRYLVIFIVVSLLIFLIVKLAQGDITFNKKVKELDISSIEDAEQNIQEADLDRLLRLALEAGDQRMALRVRYLMVLQALDENGWIDHRPDKTNLSYVKEMRGHARQEGFKRMTMIFDFLWYGEVDMDGTELQRYHRQFSDYLKSIKTSDG